MLTKEVLEYFWQQIIARLGNYVLNTTTINNQPLSSNILLTANNVNALPNNEVVSVSLGGTGYNTIVDTTYTTPRYRASTLRSSSATPSYNGTINWIYQ